MMNMIVSAIDAEIAVLTQVRGLLTSKSPGPKRGRPAWKKRRMSAEAREKIVAVQKKRWAAWKKKKATK
jgi:hypothetical protein